MQQDIETGMEHRLFKNIGMQGVRMMSTTKQTGVFQ
jgi:hypothetical protein